jgi:glycosyltransferase involved in cell wall biosynthesis
MGDSLCSQNRLEAILESVYLKIVIPTYNRPMLIAGLLSSLTEISESEKVKIVVVDDHSSRRNRACLSDLSEKYPYVDFLFLDRNSGGAGARNAGADNCEAKWIWFVDDDDFITSSTVFSVIKELEQLSSGKKMLFLSAEFKRGCEKRVVIPEGENIFKFFSRHGNQVNTTCTIFDYQLFKSVGGWDENLVAGQDTDLLLRAAEFTDAHVLSEIYVSIMDHSGERITSNPKKQMKGKVQFLIKNYKRLHPLRSLRYLVTLLIAFPYIRRVFKW